MASILLLDDDPYFRRLAVSAIEGRKHVIFEATKARDADALVAQHQFDCVIVDGLLPDSDGVSWINRFREKDQETPILFISAFWKNDQTVSKLKVSAILRKPVTPGVLVAKVEASLRNQAAPAPELSPEASRELLQLSAAFARDLPKLLREVRDAIEQLRLAPTSAAIRGVGLRRAHRLAGTAGSFGFTKVGDACAQLEEVLRGMAHDPPTDATWALVDTALIALCDRAERSPDE
jgi:two-component system, OmpR family, phosphate regulon response regulator PhoB